MTSLKEVIYAVKVNQNIELKFLQENTCTCYYIAFIINIITIVVYYIIKIKYKANVNETCMDDKNAK